MMLPAEKEFYDKVVIALMANGKVYDRKKYRMATDEDVVEDIHNMALTALRLRNTA